MPALQENSPTAQVKIENGAGPLGELAYGTIVLMRSKASRVPLHTPACETS